ncbi:MAG: N-acetylmuramoyl-L-alanine amidase [Verrucomicrobiota bacterium]
MSLRVLIGLILFSGFWGLITAEETFVVHSVQKGESLFSIGKKYGLTPSEIMKMNGITDVHKVRRGQKLKIKKMNKGAILKEEPSITQDLQKKRVLEVPDRYVVQPGEGYGEICGKFGLSEKDIREWNHGIEIEPGIVLILKPSFTKTVEKKADLEESDEEPDPEKYLFIGAAKHLIDLPHIQKGRWKYIVVHHSATSSGNAAIFDLAHRQRGMENGLAYHFVIGNGHDAKDGEIEVGNRWLKQLQGGHLRSESLNMIAIGICLVGNFEETRPTRRQQAAAIELISYLRKKLGRPYPEFKGHREINPMPTSCPGRNFPLPAFHRIFDE